MRLTVKSGVIEMYKVKFATNMPGLFFIFIDNERKVESNHHYLKCFSDLYIKLSNTLVDVSAIERTATTYRVSIRGRPFEIEKYIHTRTVSHTHVITATTLKNGEDRNTKTTLHQQQYGKMKVSSI